METQEVYQAGGQTPGRFVEIKLPRCVIFLLPEEITRLLQQDPGLWEKALRRGKAITRNRRPAKVVECDRDPERF
ncbi:hypothetical protein [Desulfotomaculum copahuensis]|uniref:Uncharacterized protein n=1 Tax=Desulfotomaculum copahuensis TaxID=1838280 RepID=A0A1B7LF66_9FIRM|nr:hypothetical protein [Desulfotomaculum copahuensis]OAT82232.1 hypothetical protein A6M21_08670 [Desulfotomaculum copahuensis]